MDAIIFPLISAKRHANNVDFQEERYNLEKVVYQLNFNQSVRDPVDSKNNIYFRIYFQSALMLKVIHKVGIWLDTKC